MEKNQFLSRIRRELATRPQSASSKPSSRDAFHWRPYEALASDYGALADLFERELTAVSGTLHRAADVETTRGILLNLLAGARSVGVTAQAAEFGILPSLAQAGIQVVEGREALAQAEAGISGALCAIAETGTLVLSPAAGESRLVPLLPPRHIALVTTHQLVPNLGRALEIARRKYGDHFPSCITLVTGPSRTADIELSLTIGVHGPGSVDVIMIMDKE